MKRKGREGRKERREEEGRERERKREGGAEGGGGGKPRLFSKGWCWSRHPSCQDKLQCNFPENTWGFGREQLRSIPVTGLYMWSCVILKSGDLLVFVHLLDFVRNLLSLSWSLGQQPGTQDGDTGQSDSQCLCLTIDSQGAFLPSGQRS